MSAYVIMVTTMHYCQQKCLDTNTMYIFADVGLKSLYVVVFVMSYEECKLFNRSLCLKTHKILGILCQRSDTGLPTDQAWKT